MPLWRSRVGGRWVKGAYYDILWLDDAMCSLILPNYTRSINDAEVSRLRSESRSFQLVGKENDELWHFACQDIASIVARLAFLLVDSCGGSMNCLGRHRSSCGIGAWMQDIAEAQLWFDHLTFDEEQA